MSFTFEKDAIKSGRENLIWGTGTLITLSVLQWFIFSKPDFPIVATIIIWMIGIFIILLTMSMGVSLLRSGGKWNISIDDKRILWDSPNESVDKSFNLFLEEISNVILRHKPSKSSGKSRSAKKPDYIIVTKSGVEFKLSPNSGVNLQMIATELERKGIELVTEYRS